MKPTPASVRARRVGVSLILCVLVQAMAPAPALAWWGWLDKWSGPGDFWGKLYSIRVVCFGEQSGVREIEAAYTRAQASTRLALRGVAANRLRPDEYSAALTDWQEAVLLVEAAQRRWHVPANDRTKVQALSTQAFGMQPGRRGLRSQSTMVTTLSNLGRDAESAIPDAAKQISTQAITAGAMGVFWSFCSDDKERRVSIELNVDDWKGADNLHNSLFSNGETIRLITVMPSLTWNVIGSRKADILEIGIGAGYYAFSSAGFDTVRGFIVQPLRVELHAPSSWAAYPWKSGKRWASLLTVRAALVSVPSGFPADAFAHPNRERIPAEMVPTLGVFANLNSLVSGRRKLPTTDSKRN